MISSIVGLLASPLLGSIVGFFGSWSTKVEERKKLSLELNHEARMADINHRNKVEELKVEGAINVEIEDIKAFDSSQTYGNQNSGVGWIDAIRTLIRPILTVYLLTVTSYLGYSLSMMIGGLEALPANEILSLYREIILSLLGLTSMSISWWYGSRGIKQPVTPVK